MIYKHKQTFELGFGVASGFSTSEYSFLYCSFESFKGTYIKHDDFTFNVWLSDVKIPRETLEKYTEEQCLEMFFEHVPAKLLMKEIYNKAFRAGAQHKIKAIRNILEV